MLAETGGVFTVSRPERSQAFWTLGVVPVGYGGTPLHPPFGGMAFGGLGGNWKNFGPFGKAVYSPSRSVSDALIVRLGMGSAEKSKSTPLICAAPAFDSTAADPTVVCTWMFL